MRECVDNYIKKENVIRFGGLCRCYMMAYQKHANSNGKTLTFHSIEKYTKKMKTHCNDSDIEKGLIEKEYAAMVLGSIIIINGIFVDEGEDIILFVLRHLP